MDTKTKKIIFWAIIAVIFIAMFLYCLLAKPGNVLMFLISGCVGIVIGWFAHVLYNKYFKKQ